MKGRTEGLSSFLKRLFGRPPSKFEIDRASGRVLQRLKKQYPDEVAAFRFFPDNPKPEQLDQFDRHVMTAIFLLGDNAHGQSITLKVRDLADKDRHVNLITLRLRYLERRGLIIVDDRENDGSRQRFYRLTPRGSYLLDRLPLAQHAAESIGDFS